MRAGGAFPKRYGFQNPAEPSPVVFGVHLSEMMVTSIPGTVSMALTADDTPMIPPPTTATFCVDCISEQSLI